MKLMDCELKHLDWLILEVKMESKKQIKKWGIQVCTPFEWLTYTTEELGELAKAISEWEYRDGSIEKIIKEAIQVATLSLKIAESYHEKRSIDFKEEVK